MLNSGDSISSWAVTRMDTASAPSSSEIGDHIGDYVKRPTMAIEAYFSLIEAPSANKYTVLRFSDCRPAQTGSSLTAYILHNVHYISARPIISERILTVQSKTHERSVVVADQPSKMSLATVS